MAEAAGDWFRDIVGAIFGSLDEAGFRHVRDVFTLVPKKNSKTTGGAGIMMTALILNKRPRAEFILVGPTQEVADTAFQQASGMIDADPEGYLQARFKAKEHNKTIVDLVNHSVLKIKTFDMKVMTGAKPVAVLLDEIHLMSAMSFASRVIGQIRGGIATRPEGFFLIITTQSDEPPAGAFKAELNHARNVRDGKVKGEAAQVLPVLYEFPEAIQRDRKKPWLNPELWHMVTPNLGRSITLDVLRTDCATAKEKGEEELRRWASQHLNIEIGIALRADRWAGADFWEAKVQSLTLDEIIERSSVLTLGIDGGGLDDLLSAGVVGRDRVDPRIWYSWGHSWAHTSVLERRKSEAEKFRDFEAAGELTIVEELGRDLDELVELAERLDHTGKLAMVGLDPAGVGAIVDALGEKGISTSAETDSTDEARVVGVSQGYQLQGAVKTTERKLADGTLIPANQGLMTYAVGNAKTEVRGNALIVTKQAAGTAKIDPLMAVYDAVALMSKNPQAAGGSLDDYLNSLAA
ncbi:terminase large subunit [Pleomorphomonas sp. NRK JP5]|nr:terminase large subunit [Pleomorphomonas sp. JP5]